MIVLVSNLGSTSFKYKLLDIRSNSEAVIAEGDADRIGLGSSNWSVIAGDQSASGTADLDDHAAAIALHMNELAGMGVEQASRLDAVGYKAVHGGPISSAVIVDDHVLDVMSKFADVAPQHNPPYIEAMKAFAARLPDVPQVAAFETGYHQTIPEKRTTYAIPYEWTELGVRKYGFHGASHRYIATRMAEIAPEAQRIISCHLGGSCSICAIQDGKSVANSFGMTVQTGVTHASRVGDFDTFALLKLLAADINLDEIWQKLGKNGGLLGLSGVSSDLREIEIAADQGNQRARLAIDVFVESVRDYIGSYLAVLHGADAICFTGGIGQHGKAIRRAVLEGFEFAGVKLDLEKNKAADGRAETRIDVDGGDVAVWVLPTNEELIVARQAVEVLQGAESRN